MIYNIHDIINDIHITVGRLRITWVHSFGIVTRHPVILRELQERGCL